LVRTQAYNKRRLPLLLSARSTCPHDPPSKVKTPKTPDPRSSETSPQRHRASLLIRSQLNSYPPFSARPFSPSPLRKIQMSKPSPKLRAQSIYCPILFLRYKHRVIRTTFAAAQGRKGSYDVSCNCAQKEARLNRKAMHLRCLFSTPIPRACIWYPDGCFRKSGVFAYVCDS
jgi:hypothetical protein